MMDGNTEWTIGTPIHLLDNTQEVTQHISIKWTVQTR